jgi:hypothetical protein
MSVLSQRQQIEELILKGTERKGTERNGKNELRTERTRAHSSQKELQGVQFFPKWFLF